MFFLVRKSVLGSSDEFQDLDFDVSELTIGSNESNAVVLDELTDGEVTIKVINDTDAKFTCTGGLVISINDKKGKSGKIRKGHVYRLGVYDIEVVTSPTGFDFALNISRSKRKSTVINKSYELKSTKSLFSARTFSYLAFLAIILFFLVIPFMGSQNKDIQNKLNQMHIPTDNSWSSGPLAMAHRIPEIGDKCNICHVKPFQKVQDAQCKTCHRKLDDHIAKNHPAVEELSQFLCENCHKEHNEPLQLTRTDDALCVDCHARIEDFMGNSSDKNLSVQKVTGFNSNSHPPFRLSLISPLEENGSYEWIKSRPLFDPNVKIKESSNLKFTHEVHLDDEKVQDESNGEALVCNDCHQLKEDGEHFEPITMDKDCRSCHKLSFDVFNPDLELQHGSLRTATVMLQAHYIREFTDPELRAKRAKKKIRRIPGKHTNDATCQGTGLDCGRAEALKEAEFQFTQSGCITCHEVITRDTSDILSKWFVKPIKITNDWFSKATFDHVSHLSVKDQDEEQICLSCHNVESSNHSEDIAMPQRNKCLECHQQGMKTSVELSCIRCHAFHFEENEKKDLKNE